jgi:predicted amidohydrolase YtcJ
MLLTNGRIYTLDARSTICDTLLLVSGRIVFAGHRSEIQVPAGEETLDLGGRAVLPGLVDAHGHLSLMARARLALDASGALSEDEVARRVMAAARRLPGGEWITGRGWDETRWSGEALPTRQTLDRAAPEHPVALRRVDGHALWCNSAALAAAGITRATAEPAGGRILKDATGEPTGILIDAAQGAVDGVTPPPSEERFDRAVGDVIGECLAKGLTGVHEMGVGLRGLGAYRRLLASGRFPFRVYAALAMTEGSTWDVYRERGPEEIGDGRVVVGAVKLWLDGALGSRGAALHAPYCDDSANTGLILIPPDELERRVLDATTRGFQVCVHAIGDRANTLALDVFERAREARPGGADNDFRIEHAQVLAPADIPRFQRLGVVPSMQPTHCISDMRWAEARLGPDRLAGAYAWRSLLATGVRIAGGSDFPVEDSNPFLGIQAAVTRRHPGSGEGWQPEQRMTREEAVRTFTTWNAHASRQDANAGALVPGSRADLVVLSEDVLTCAEDEISRIVPELTMVAGEIAFRRDG